MISQGVTFLGQDDEYVASGSDCGHLFIWSKRDGVLRHCLKGDSRIVNCVEPHPQLPFTLATSGTLSAGPRRLRRSAVLPRVRANASRALIQVVAASRSLAGIDNDIKIWAPLENPAWQPESVSHLDSVIRSNVNRRGGASLYQEPSLLQLMLLRHISCGSLSICAPIRSAAV